MIRAIDHDADWITVGWDDGATSRYPAVWLRDNVPSGRHRAEGQRTFDINALDGVVAIASASLIDDGVEISFSDGLADLFPMAWLAAHPLRGSGAGAIPNPVLWSGEEQSRLQFADYRKVSSDRVARLDWLRQLREYGYALLANTDVSAGMVLRAVDLFGFVRETNYGRLFDVIVRPDPANLANTPGHIGMHTDNPYRDPVPGLQLLHCIVNQTNGGESQLVDGFAAATRLRAEDPAAFRTLVQHPVRFRYLEAGDADLQSYRPLIEVGPAGAIIGLRYNSRSAAPVEMAADTVPEFYRAYRALADRLNDPAARIEFKLSPGDLMVFDNQRVLHGRSAYTEGHRHLQGCYADKDSLHSTIRVLEAEATS